MQFNSDGLQTLLLKVQLSSSYLFNFIPRGIRITGMNSVFGNKAVDIIVIVLIIINIGLLIFLFYYCKRKRTSQLLLRELISETGSQSRKLCIIIFHDTEPINWSYIFIKTKIML